MKSPSQKECSIRILMFDAGYPPPIKGGKEKQAHLLSRALKRQGCQVEAISYAEQKTFSDYFDNIFVHRIKPSALSPFFFFLILAKKRLHFDVLHIHTPSRIGKLMVFMGKILGYRIVFKFPGQNLIKENNFLKKIPWLLLVKLTNLFVVLEKETKKKLLSINTKEKNIFFAQNGVNVTVIPEKKNNEIFSIVYIGRLVQVKLCDQAIQACALLKKDELNFRLTIVGEGPLYTELEKLTENLNLKEHISFKGYQSDTLSFLKNADVLILPSLTEGMSNVILEAMSIGLPVVATSVGAAKYQLGEFGEQFLCNPHAPQCLADKVSNLAMNPSLREQYSYYLHGRAQALFSMEIVARQYQEQYMRIQ